MKRRTITRGGGREEMRIDNNVQTLSESDDDDCLSIPPCRSRALCSSRASSEAEDDNEEKRKCAKIDDDVDGRSRKRRNATR